MKKICKKCDGGIMSRDETEYGSPIWACRNCGHKISRRTWKTKARIEKEMRIAATIASLGSEA